MAHKFLNEKQTAHIDRNHQTDTEWIKASVDLSCYKGNSTSHFSITAEVGDVKNGRRYSAHSFGCMHKKVAEHFSDLEPLIRWHLTGMNAPMHYLANSLYHLGLGAYPDARNLEHFKSTAIIGSVRGDEEKMAEFLELEEMVSDNTLFDSETRMQILKEFAADWLNERLERLMISFDTDMRNLFQFETD